VFDDRDDFRADALSFLADGLARGCRVRYVAAGDVEALRAEVAPLAGLPQADRPGAVEVESVTDTYGVSPATTAVDATGQVAAYAVVTQAAVADGFTGLRVAADSPSSCARPSSSTPSPATSTASTGS
jgi:hypothetical protein